MHPSDRTMERPKSVYVTTNYTILPEDDFIFTDGSGGAITLTLPHLADVLGKFLTIMNLAGTNNIVLVVPDNEAANYAAIEALDIDAVNDYIVLRANPHGWELIVNAIA